MPLGLLRGLFGGNRNGASKEEEPRKDKYAQRKQNEADLKAAHKKELQEAKHAAKEEQHAAAEVFRMDRAHNEMPGKRAAKDAREEKRHQEKAESGFTCEHGVYKCRICHPVTKHK